MKKQRSAIAVALIGAALSGCTVGPDFRQPDSPTAQRYTETPVPSQTVGAPGLGGAPQRLVNGGAIPDQWWALFRSAALDQLIRDAIARSPNLDAAQATLRQARENLAAQTGALLYPQVDGNLGATREKISGAALGEPGVGTGVFTLYNASVNVSYALDIAGHNRRELESLGALVDYQGFQLEAAYLTLTSNIVTAVAREAALRGQISATQEIIAAEQQSLSLLQRQHELGGIGRLDVLAQGAQVAQTRATLPPLEHALAQTRHELATLTGRTPSEADLPVFDLDALELPRELPVSLPSELVRQRPDIRASEALLHQASAQVGVATANLYPQITLSGAFGGESSQLHNLLAGPSVWSLAGGLLQPLFHGGQLQAERRAAIAAFDTAQAQYRQTVLQAFQNVADALRALEDDARALQAQSQAETLSRDTLDLTRRQYRLGGATYLAQLIAQRQYQQTRILLVQAQAARYADTAALFQALGGGWWNRDNAAANGNSPAVN